MLIRIKSVWNYKDFILNSIKREFQSKYQNSILGALWNILNPLAIIIVYTVIFAQIMQAKLPGVSGNYAYGIYLCSGLLVWTYFTDILSQTMNMFIANANTLKKINFPRLCLPIIILGNATLNYFIIFGLFCIALVFMGSFPYTTILAIIPLLILLILFTFGFGLMLGILNVFFRDVGQFIGIVLQFWFWLTPIVYPITILPDKIRQWIELNPMIGIIDGFQQIIVFNQFPDWSKLKIMVCLTFLFWMLTITLYKKLSVEIMDEL